MYRERCFFMHALYNLSEYSWIDWDAVAGFFFAHSPYHLSEMSIIDVALVVIIQIDRTEWFSIYQADKTKSRSIKLNVCVCICVLKIDTFDLYDQCEYWSIGHIDPQWIFMVRCLMFGAWYVCVCVCVCVGLSWWMRYFMHRNYIHLHFHLHFITFSTLRL